MGTYRVFFRRGDGIVGRLDFDAADDKTAAVMAKVLCGACSDLCGSFDLWQGARCVTPTTAPSDFSLREQAIMERSQDAIVACEEAIQRSEWAIASSKRLLERLAQLRDTATRRRESG